jgi:hypothetical protein
MMSASKLVVMAFRLSWIAIKIAFRAYRFSRESSSQFLHFMRRL